MSIFVPIRSDQNLYFTRSYLFLISLNPLPLIKISRCLDLARPDSDWAVSLDTPAYSVVEQWSGGDEAGGCGDEPK